VGAPHDRAHVLHEAAAEDHVRERNEQRLFVDGLQVPLERHRHPVFAGHGDDARPQGAVGLVHVHHGREVQVLVDDLVAASGQVEAGQEHRLADGDVLVHDHRAGPRPDDPSHGVADGDGHRPPPLGPGAHAARGPRFGIIIKALISFLWHGAQTVRNQIDSLLEDGKLTAPFYKVVGHYYETPMRFEKLKSIYHKAVNRES
jgi:hypothetical protein